MSTVRGQIMIVAALAAGACSKPAPIPPGPFDSERGAQAAAYSVSTLDGAIVV